MVKTTKNVFFSIFAVLLAFLLSFTPIFAATTENNTETTQQTTTKKESISTNDIIGRDLVDNAPSVGELSNKLEKKGFQIVGLLQKVTSPILMIFLIIALILAVVGFVTGAKQQITYGIGAIILIGLVYVAIMYAPELLDSFAMFIISE